MYTYIYICVCTHTHTCCGCVVLKVSFLELALRALSVESNLGFALRLWDQGFSGFRLSGFRVEVGGQCLRLSGLKVSGIGTNRSPVVSIVVRFFGFNQVYLNDFIRYPPKKNYNGDSRQDGMSKGSGSCHDCSTAA